MRTALFVVGLGVVWLIAATAIGTFIAWGMGSLPDSPQTPQREDGAQ